MTRVWRLAHRPHMYACCLGKPLAGAFATSLAMQKLLSPTKEVLTKGKLYHWQVEISSGSACLLDLAQ